MIRPTWTVVVFDELEPISRIDCESFEAAETKAKNVRAMFARLGVPGSAIAVPSARSAHPATERAFPKARVAK
jgi:hypothetical protein